MTKPAAPTDDTGSVMPLVLGMVLCLLVLGAGVTAATSAFIAHNRLQHACDGAAAAAADAAKRGQQFGDATSAVSNAQHEAVTYLQARRSPAQVQARGTDDAIELTCTTDAAITFGGLFGHSTLGLTAHAVGHSVLAP